MSVTRGQCDTRPTVTFPAARHHRQLVSTNLYCLATGTRVNLPRVALKGGSWDSNPQHIARKSGTILLRHRATLS